VFRQLAARVIWSSGLRAMWSSDVRWFALERVLRIMVTALGMACARWRRGEKTGARPRAVGWRSSLTNVPRVSRPVGLCNLYLSSMIESENAAALQHNETVSSCSSSSSSRELCVCVFLSSPASRSATSLRRSLTDGC